MEGKEWIYESGIWQERELQRTKKLIQNSSKKTLEKNIVKIFEQYFKNI